MIECTQIYMQKYIYFFIGTTAELIKLAPVIKELKKRKVNFKIIASNQNVLNFYELKALIGKQAAYYTFKFKPMKLPKNIYLQFAIWAIKAFSNHLLYFRNEFKGLNRKNSLFIVHGDTISALLGAIIAKIYRIPLVHIESGLRSFNFFEPFPEEFCRFIVSKLADIHFCPNLWAVNNLKNNNGIKVNTQQNTLIESLTVMLKTDNKLQHVKLLPKNFFLLVLHRQEHILFKKNLTKFYLKILTEYANDNLTCVLVIHKLTERFLKEHSLLSNLQKNKNIILVPRLPYGEFIHLMKKSEFIATDGGSNQEEAYYIGKPCLILRSVTERIEGLGKNAVLSYGNESIVKNFIKNYKKYQKNPVHFTISPSKIIVDYLLKYH